MAQSCGTLLVADLHIKAAVGSNVRIVNLLESCFPSIDKTCRHVDHLIRESRKTGVRVMKLIHGYDSTGAGKRLRLGLRAHLWQREKDGEIRAFIPGERWAQFDQQSRELLKQVPESIVDSDFCRTNKGVTLIVL
ncbi:MAG TPA: hypothetical protein VFV92_04820 [Candidatus Bathyarchaeia archaeon]|nr:hypothetical protein [Candidatus Bathyarchaeia archaeon]